MKLISMFNRQVAGAATVTSALALLPLSAAVAQSLPPGLSSPGTSDLTQVVQQALATNPEVHAAWNGLRAAGNDVGVARGNYLPSIDASAGIGVEDREFDTVGSYETSFYELSLTQMIYDGFATRNEVERLDRAKLVRYYELLGASENVALEAARAYLDVSRYRELVRLAQDNYAQHQRVYDQIEERVRSGAGRGVDLEQISGRLALAESNLMTEAANLHDVTARYLRIVGELPTETLAAAPQLDNRLPASVSEAIDLAFQGNPEFHAAIENIESSRAEQQGTRAAFQPRLDLRGRTGNYRNESGFDGVGRRDRHRLELVASMNLYRGGSDLASFRAASDRVEQAVNQREVACNNVRQTTQIAYNDTRRLREQLDYLNQHRQSIDRVRGAYQQQFDIGERTLLDVLDSENEFFEASRAFVNAEYDVALADARTLAAMGQLMQTLDVVGDDMPTLSEMGSDGVDLDPDSICPTEGPMGYTLADFTGGDAPAPTRAPDITMSADALFAINSAELSAEARGELTELASQIRGRNDLVRIFIAGHADTTGNDAINDPLSQDRADSVASHLVSQGVRRELIQTEGYGSREPVATNDTVEGRRQNRRVEVTLEREDERLDMTSAPVKRQPTRQFSDNDALSSAWETQPAPSAFSVYSEISTVPTELASSSSDIAGRG
ncbi:TolC family outer membrane protein [Halomonas urumqiensis]|uniref:Agglutination protein n=1 Tax=Halomonas urumqiensis TaxID=1684789 RepID=A0A2N7UGS0_9GAMM|nr:TolC family outer membrane protein [Halomonas urumqiensis]PMR79611.1 agglutination protein [Halomonas urumqiensis]PTB01061.1 agglutination protein [Halomonas urumqiensis]GHE22864.1 hypothetical protein GCM10017767_33850 [Halomonas urumqiensis]